MKAKFGVLAGTLITVMMCVSGQAMAGSDEEKLARRGGPWSVVGLLPRVFADVPQPIIRHQHENIGKLRMVLLQGTSALPDNKEAMTIFGRKVMRMGTTASFDYGEHVPHVTVAHGVNQDFDASGMEPHRGRIMLAEMSVADAAGYAVGDRVRVKPRIEHNAITRGKTGTVIEIGTPALAVKFEGMPDVHKWYVAEELEGESYSVGDRVKVKPGLQHDKMTIGKTGTIVEIGTPALGVKFDDMPEVHNWYVAEELDPA